MKHSILQLVDYLNMHHLKEITILGHDQIDEDSCISGLLLRDILRHYEINAQFKICDGIISRQTKEVLKYLGYDLDAFVVEELSENEPVFLVDHYETKHSDRVIGCIDHHPTSKVFDYPIYDNSKASACTKKIYDMALHTTFVMTRQKIKEVVCALMIDTFAFKSSRGTLEDKKWMEQMIKCYDLDEEKFRGFALRLTNLEQSVETIAMSSFKTYRFGKNVVGSTYVIIEKKPNHLNHILSYLQKKVQEEKWSLWVFLTVNVVEDVTTSYEITVDEIQSYSYSKLASRAQDIMPKIERKILKKEGKA